MSDRNMGFVRSGMLFRGILTELRYRDFADDHPNVEVVGTDILPIQPSWVSPNLKL